MRNLLFAFVLLASVAPAQVGDVIITEILYNASGASDSLGEWVEIYNVSANPVNIGEWYLQDEDGPAGDTLDAAGVGAMAAFGIPAGTMIMPGEAVVLHCGCNTTTDFQAAWGTGFQVFAMDRWEFDASDGLPRLNNLSNSPSTTNEVLTLRDTTGTVIDTANFDDSGTWPNQVAGSSIFVIPTALDDVNNDMGANWMLSMDGVLGAFTATSTGNIGNDIGSPGAVATSLNPFPGPSDLQIDVFINGVQDFAINGQHTLPLPSDVLGLNTFSPMGTFTGTGVLFIGQFFTTGMPPGLIQPFGLPFDSSNTAFIVYDGLAPGTFFTPVLPQFTSGLVPLAFFGQGLSILFTMLNVDPSAVGSLGFSDSEEIVLP